MSMNHTSENDYGSSFFNQCNEDADIPPYQLSGDETSESVVASFAAASKANFLLTVTTIMKTVIGAGILSLPFTVSRLGYVFSLLTFVIILAANQFTCVLLLKTKNLSKHSNYTSISYHIFRSKGFQAAISICILINNLGICIVELEIFKQAIRKILQDFLQKTDHAYVLDQFYTSPIFIVLIFALVLSPFTLVKKIEKLKFMAFVGVSGITIFVVSLIIHFFVVLSENDWTIKAELSAFPPDWTKAIAVIPNMMLALAYQMNFFPIFKGMRNSSDPKMKKASITGMCACAFFYIVVGNLGYALYGKDAPANFLLALDKDEVYLPFFVLMNGGFLVSVYFSFPVMFFGARNNFIALFKMISLRKSREAFKSVHGDTIQQISSYMEAGNKQQKQKRAKIMFYVYTLVLYLIAVGITIAVDSVEAVFNIVGAIASNSIGFIFPALFYIWAVNKKNKDKNLNYYIAWVVFCVFIPIGISAIVFQYVDPN